MNFFKSLIAKLRPEQKPESIDLDALVDTEFLRHIPAEKYDEIVGFIKNLPVE